MSNIDKAVSRNFFKVSIENGRPTLATLSRLGFAGERGRLDLCRVVLEMEKIKRPFSGLGQFCWHLGRALEDELSNDRELALGLYLPAGAQKHFSRARLFRSSLWHRYMGFFLPRASVWHALHQDSPYGPPRGAKLVLSVHDLNFLYGPKPQKKKDALLRALERKVQRAAVVTAISHYTRQDMERNLELHGKTVRVIHNGVHVARPAGVGRPAYVPAGDFLFCVGAILPKKNFRTLVGMMEALPEKTLILAGPDQHAYAKQIKNEVREKNLEERFIMPGEISEQDRYWLFDHCQAFVFPSTTEGFGFPVAEALSFGKPTFTTRATSLPEVAGPEAFYFDSFGPQDMAACLQRGLGAFTADPQAAERCRSWAQQFSWRKAAQSYLAIYRELCLRPHS